MIIWRSTWGNYAHICFTFVNCTRIWLWIIAVMAQTVIMFCTYASHHCNWVLCLRIASIPCFKLHNWSTFLYKGFSLISACRNIFFSVHVVAIALAWPVMHCQAFKTGRTKKEVFFMEVLVFCSESSLCIMWLYGRIIAHVPCFMIRGAGRTPQFQHLLSAYLQLISKKYSYCRLLIS